MDSPTSPARLPNRGLLLAGIAAVVAFVADRATKEIAEAYLVFRESHRVLGDYVQLTLWYNEGAAFGVRLGGQWVHVALSIAAMALVGWLIWSTPRHERLMLFSFGLIMGGAVGNLYDRLVAGRVTDFIEVGVGRLRWPTFNVADAWVVIGIILLLFAHMRSGRTPESTADAHGDEQPAHSAGGEGRAA